MPTLVLVADDSPTIRGFVKLVLRGLPVEVAEAEDGAQALAVARERAPRLALVDVQMPELDGLGVLRALRQDPRPELRALPVLLLTGERSEAVRAAALEAGAQGLVGKPINPQELREAVLRFAGPGSGP